PSAGSPPAAVTWAAHWALARNALAACASAPVVGSARSYRFSRTTVLPMKFLTRLFQYVTPMKLAGAKYHSTPRSTLSDSSGSSDGFWALPVARNCSPYRVEPLGPPAVGPAYRLPYGARAIVLLNDARPLSSLVKSMLKSRFGSR